MQHGLGHAGSRGLKLARLLDQDGTKYHLEARGRRVAGEVLVPDRYSRVSPDAEPSDPRHSVSGRRLLLGRERTVPGSAGRQLGMLLAVQICGFIAWGCRRGQSVSEPGRRLGLQGEFRRKCSHGAIDTCDVTRPYACQVCLAGDPSIILGSARVCAHDREAADGCDVCHERRLLRGTIADGPAELVQVRRKCMA